MPVAVLAVCVLDAVIVLDDVFVGVLPAEGEFGGVTVAVPVFAVDSEEDGVQVPDELCANAATTNVSSRTKPRRGAISTSMFLETIHNALTKHATLVTSCECAERCYGFLL